MTLPLPEAFRSSFDGLEEQRLSGDPDNRFHQCFGCGPSHPAGLHVRTFKTPEGVASPIVIAKQYEGPPGAAHGGIVAAYLDLRANAQELFVDTVKRIGVEPFKERVYATH